MMKGKFRRTFTLLEVMISLAILALSLTAILELMTASQKRIAKAEERWRHTHMLSQAAEYYMMQNEEEPVSISEEFFPYKDYRIDVANEDADGLPEEYTSLEEQIPLKKRVITLRRLSDGKDVDSITIDFLSYESGSEALQ